MLNKWIIQGRLTRDPEIKTTGSGVSLLNITVAVDRDFKNGDEKLCDFVPVVLWRHNAEYVGKYGKKGDMVTVCGSGQIRKYQDKDGNERTVTEIVGESAYLGSRRSSDASTTPAFSPMSASDNSEDDLPF